MREKYVVLDVPNKPMTTKPWRASCFHDDGPNGCVDAASAWAETPQEALKLACADVEARGWRPESLHIRTSALARLKGVVDSVTDDPESPVFGLPVVIRKETCSVCGDPLVAGQVVDTSVPGQTAHMTCPAQWKSRKEES